MKDMACNLAWPGFEQAAAAAELAARATATVLGSEHSSASESRLRGASPCSRSVHYNRSLACWFQQYVPWLS